MASKTLVLTGDIKNQGILGLSLKNRGLLVNSADSMRDLGQGLAHYLHGGETIFLSGDLGAGKTTLVQGLAKGLGVLSRVTSPTFVLVRTHLCHDEKIHTLAHVDLYRLSPKEVKQLGLDDYWGQPGFVVVIEWPDRLKIKPPGKIIGLKLSHARSGGRLVKLQRGVLNRA